MTAAKPLVTAFVLAAVLTAPALGRAAAPVTAPAGAYKLDKAHASLTFQVNHMGFSRYTARFTRFDASLNLDPAHPARSSVTATVDPKSLSLNTPPPGFEDEIRGPNWLNAAKYPQMSFRSTRVTPTGPNTARIDGDFTLHGVTKPVTLQATFIGGYPGMAMDPNARVGFSARGVLKRSQFGITLGIPAPGTTMGVSDAVDFDIEAEFSGPAWKAPPAKR